MKLNTSAFALRLVSALTLISTSSMAGEFSKGRKVDNPPMSRSAGAMETPKAGSRTGGPERTEAAARDVFGEDKASTLRMISRSRDGTSRTLEPSQRVLDAAKGMKKADSGTREVIGKDDRQLVLDATEHPNITVGLLESVHSNPELIYDCTATLIGPRIAITAANCVYNHELEGGWLEETMFWPAMNGENAVPFGSVDWSDMYVLEEYITAYDGSYNSVWPYDIAIIVFAEPVGMDLGWMGYNSFPDLGTFDAHLVGYGEGEEPWLQFRSKCKVISKTMSELDFLHRCDADYMSIGAAMYIHDEAEGTYTVAAINQGSDGEQNWALRITEPIALWIDDLNVE